MARSGSWKGRAVLAAALLLAACSGERKSDERDVCPVPSGVEVRSGAGELQVGEKAPVRREFVVLRELVKQHAAQQEAGNEARLEAVQRHLGEWLARVPDEGANDEERAILRRARKLRDAQMPEK